MSRARRVTLTGRTQDDFQRAVPRRVPCDDAHKVRVCNCFLYKMRRYKIEMWRRDPSPERPEPEGAAPHTSRRVALFADPTDQSKIMIHVLRILIIDAHISSRFRPNGTARLSRLKRWQE